MRNDKYRSEVRTLVALHQVEHARKLGGYGFRHVAAYLRRAMRVKYARHEVVRACDCFCRHSAKVCFGVVSLGCHPTFSNEHSLAAGRFPRHGSCSNKELLLAQSEWN